MIWDQKKLIGLNVNTQDGQHLGKIKSFEVNTDTAQIVKFIVANSNLVKKILQEDIIIDKNQVIEITAVAMVVESTIIKDRQASEDPALS